MSVETEKAKPKVTAEDIQAKVEQIQGRVKRELISNQALIAVGAVVAVGLLVSLSFWLGRRSR